MLIKRKDIKPGQKFLGYLGQRGYTALGVPPGDIFPGGMMFGMHNNLLYSNLPDQEVHLVVTLSALRPRGAKFRLTDSPDTWVTAGYDARRDTITAVQLPEGQRFRDLPPTAEVIEL